MRKDINSLPSLLRGQRHQQKLSLRKMSVRTGIPFGRLSEFERGIATPSSRTVPRLAAGYRVAEPVLFMLILERRLLGLEKGLARVRRELRGTTLFGGHQPADSRPAPGAQI